MKKNTSKYTIIGGCEHCTYLLEKHNKKKCLECHVFINKKYNADIYGIYFSTPAIWKYAAWCDFPIEVCVVDKSLYGFIDKELDNLEHSGVEMTKVFFDEIFGKPNNKNYHLVF